LTVDFGTFVARVLLVVAAASGHAVAARPGPVSGEGMPARAERGEAGMDDVIAMDRGGQRYFYLCDGHGNVAALTDSGGNVVERYRYDAYGRPEFLDALGAVKSVSCSDYGNPLLFQSRNFDPETGLCYFRARYYSPALGRFLSRDPNEYADATNLYQYCLQNPGNLRDPSGEFAFLPILAIAGLAFITGHEAYHTGSYLLDPKHEREQSFGLALYHAAGGEAISDEYQYRGMERFMEGVKGVSGLAGALSSLALGAVGPAWGGALLAGTRGAHIVGTAAGLAEAGTAFATSTVSYLSGEYAWSAAYAAMGLVGLSSSFGGWGRTGSFQKWLARGSENDSFFFSLARSEQRLFARGQKTFSPWFWARHAEQLESFTRGKSGEQFVRGIVERGRFLKSAHPIRSSWWNVLDLALGIPTTLKTGPDPAARRVVSWILKGIPPAR
jgi:RHS repeat-associated protein